jgi:hypothetical protein
MLAMLTRIRNYVPPPLMNTYRQYIAANRYRTTQVFFIGYPRSGTTWIRFLLGRYIQLVSGEKELHLFGRYDLLGRCEKALVGPAMNFSHGGLHWLETTVDQITEERFITPYLGKGIVLIARYPLDVLVSNWAYDRNLSRISHLDLPDYLEDPIVGLERYIKFNNLWARTRKSFSDLTLFRYEDFQNDPIEGLSALLRSLKIPPQIEAIKSAVEFSSLTNMKDIQQNHGGYGIRGGKSAFFRVGTPENPEAQHVRKGKIGGYRDYLGVSSSKHYEGIVKNRLDPWFGYQHTPIDV